LVAGVLFLSLFLFMILQVPVGLAIGCSAISAAAAGAKLSFPMITKMLIVGVDSFPIMAIPFFVLAGDLMGAGGISKRLLNFFDVLFGRMYGGTAIVTVAVAMFFAAVSGSGPATVAAVGAMVIPTMTLQGYDKKFSLSLVAAAGTIGVIIPPSIPMVIYGTTTGTSITSMFAAGFGPGILIGIVLMIYCHIYARKRGILGSDTPFSFKRLWKAFWDAKWAILNPFIILGGIYSGIFTPTEAASVAAVYAFFIGVFVYKELSLKNLFSVVSGSCITTGCVMAILGCATAFAKIVTIERIPEAISSAMIAMTSEKVLMLILINLLLLIVGCFMDTPPAIMILSPILLPIAKSFGIDPVHFGIIMVVNLAIGFITPPLGVNLFVASRVGNENLAVVLKGIVPFLLLMILCLLVISFVPAISMTFVNAISS